MNLIIDIGNTKTKIATFSKNEMVHHVSYFNAEIGKIVEEIEQTEANKAIISAVRDIDKEVEKAIEEKGIECLHFNHETNIPVKNKYKTPHTLGYDRLASAIGAYWENKGRNILVIDAGTCITYDFVNKEGSFMGGNISPGVEMRFAAMHTMTSKLPRVEKIGDTPSMGYDTETAIRAGVMKGIEYEMKGYIEEMTRKYGDVLCFLTGGEHFSFDTKLKNTIFADNFLLLKGLNYILNYNI